MSTPSAPTLLRITIEAQAPLAFPQRKPGLQFQQSLGYVSGGVLYGALGAAFDPRTFGYDAHLNLFERIRCHNAYPMYTDSAQLDQWVRPIPLTAMTPKGSDSTTPPTDTLVEQVCWEQQQPAALLPNRYDAQGRPWQTSASGFYTLVAGSTFQRCSVTQRILTRVAINRRRRIAEESRLYSLFVINESSPTTQHTLLPTRFLGSVVTSAIDAEEITNALQQITQLGARQTSGLGRVHLTSERVEPEPVATVRARIETLTRQFQDRTALLTQLGGKEMRVDDYSIFTINLLSDAILYEQGWLPSTLIDTAWLGALLGCEVGILRAFTQTYPVGGWNVSWQRPKATELVTAKGSVYVVQAMRPLNDAAIAALAALQWDGIGERRSEGYGQVRICDEFHLYETSRGAV